MSRFESFKNFLEKLIEGVGPLSILLIIFFIYQHRKSEKKETTLFLKLLITILIIDFGIRFLNMLPGRNTAMRYFMLEVTFSLLPAAYALLLLKEKYLNQKKFIIVLVIISIGQLAQTFRPQKYDPFIFPAADIVKQNPSNKKLIYGDFPRANFYAEIREPNPHKQNFKAALRDLKQKNKAPSDVYILTELGIKDVHKKFNNRVTFKTLKEFKGRKSEQVFLYQATSTTFK